MASLALGVVGAAVGFFVGGPVGAQVGFLFGSLLGNALFPEHQEGPRLTDKRIQTSTYGAMIPIVYGTVRLAGNVIDQSPEYDEHQHDSGGKGGPEVTTYTYSASIDVSLCEGPIVAVRKVWADGRLMYDTSPGGDTTSVRFTLYLGDETQLPDPTFEAIHGVGNVPAYRGTAHVVFADLDVTQFGNRLPFLEFEVLTRAHTNAALHITKEHQDSNSPPFIWAGTPFLTGTFPAILQWDPTGEIRIKERGTTTMRAYDEDLVYTTDEETGPLDFLPDEIDITQTVSHSPLTWIFNPVGNYIMDDVAQPVWVCTTNPVTAGTVFPALAAVDVFLNGGDFPESSGSFAESSGILAGEYVRSVALTKDAISLFAFTAPSSGGTTINKWYKITNGVVVDQGTVSPALGLANLGYGSYQDGFDALQFENNGKWCWKFHGAGVAGGTAMVYSIDTDNNFALNAVCGTLNISDPQSFNAPSISVLEEGYCGMVFGRTLVIVSRFPVNESLDIPVSDIVADLSVRVGIDPADYDVSDLEEDLVPGYMIGSQMTARSAIEPLQQCYFFDAVESDLIKFVKRGQASILTIDDDNLAAHAYGDTPPNVLDLVRTQEEELPAKVYVKYLNQEADYQQNTQLSQRMVTRSRQTMTVEAAIVITDGKAKQVADGNLYELWNTRNRRKFYTTRRYSALEPCDVITIQGQDLRIVNSNQHANGVLELDAVLSRSQLLLQGSASGGAGGFTRQTVTPAQATQLIMLDIPMVTDDDTGGPYAAMAGATSDLWRGATLFRSSDGSTYSSIATSAVADVIGTATTALPDFLGGNTFDEASTLHVSIGLGGGTLSSYTHDAVLSGAGMYLVGSEILQAKNAVLTAPGEYDLSGFLRGRRGTEWAIGTHGGSETVVKLPTTVNLPADSANLNILKYYKAITTGRNAGSAVQFTNTGNAIRPYSPTHLGGGFQSNGDATLIWQRRTRIGGQWRSYTDVPLSESSEGYFVEIWDATYTTLKRTISGLTTQTATYTAAQQTTDFGSPQLTVYFKVFQQGTFLPSRGTRGQVPNPVITWTSDLEPVPGVVPVPPSSGGGAATIPLTWSTPGELQAYSRDYGGFAPDGAISISFTTPAGTSTANGRLSLVEFQDPPTPRDCCLSTVNGDFNTGIPGYSASKIAGDNEPRVFFWVGTPAPAGAVRLESSTTYYWNVRNGVTNATSCNIQVTLQKPTGL